MKGEDKVPARSTGKTPEKDRKDPGFSSVLATNQPYDTKVI